MEIPKVNYRFGDLWLITDFLTVGNPDINNARAPLLDPSDDVTVENIAAYVRDNFQYPLDNAGNPSTDGQIVRYRKALFPPSYGWRVCNLYVWAFPPEVMQSKLGYCAETANLAVSLLLPRLNAFVCLGEVRTAQDDRLLGYHAWGRVRYHGEDYLDETTIHVADTITLVSAKSAYDRKSDWAQQGNLYYLETACYNKTEFTGDAGIVTRLSLPAKRIMASSLEETLRIRSKRLYKELRVEHRMVHNLLKEAYHVR